MSKSMGVRRLMREAQELAADASDEYEAAPLEDNLYEWHFSLRGPADSEYEEGIYHGRLVMPPDFPLRPPEVYMLTASGRFETNAKICLSISSMHPESWQPSWGVRTALVALRAFFATDPMGAAGSLSVAPEERRRLARASRAFSCAKCGWRAPRTEGVSQVPHTGGISQVPHTGEVHHTGGVSQVHHTGEVHHTGGVSEVHHTGGISQVPHTGEVHHTGGVSEVHHTGGVSEVSPESRTEGVAEVHHTEAISAVSGFSAESDPGRGNVTAAGPRTERRRSAATAMDDAWIDRAIVLVLMALVGLAVQLVS